MRFYCERVLKSIIIVPEESGNVSITWSAMIDICVVQRCANAEIIILGYQETFVIFYVCYIVDKKENNIKTC